MGLLRKEDMHESFWKEGISNPNLLINGDFQVWQRGTSFNTNNINIYTADRWQLNDGSANKCDFGIKIQRTNNTNEINFEQAIENIQKLKGKTLTLSWESKINKNMEIGVLAYSFTSDRTPIIFAETNVSYDSSLDIQKHSLTFKIHEDLNSTCSNLSIRIIRRTSEAELSIELRNIKLEIGDHPTQFIPRPYGEELALCQRYFMPMTWENRTWLHGFGQNHWLFVPLPNKMRTLPTLWGGASVPANWSLCSNGSAITPTDLKVRTLGGNGVLIQFTGDFNNNHALIGYYNSATLGGFDAEIY